MTRQYIYVVSLLAFTAISALTLASILLPRWISWDSETVSGHHIHYTYGLHKRCSSLTKKCPSFPQPEDCQNDRYFCSMWRTVGFLMSFAVVVECATLITYVIILAGGKQRREAGWKILASLHLMIALLLGSSLSIIAYLYDHDDRFFPGWKLDVSWILCTTGFAAALVLTAGIVVSALILPSEDGYELVPNYDSDEDS